MTKKSALHMRNPLLRGFVAAALVAASAAADDYVVTVDEADTRLARVVATLVPEGDIIAMNDEGNQGLERGWATFVEDLRVTHGFFGSPFWRRTVVHETVKPDLAGRMVTFRSRAVMRK